MIAAYQVLNNMSKLSRIDEYKYLLNSMRSIDEKTLEFACEKFGAEDINIYDHAYVFPYPHDALNFETITNSLFHRKRPKFDAEWRFYKILKEYLILFVDLDFSCCGDGRDFLTTDDQRLFVKCESCDRIVDFAGRDSGDRAVRIADRKTLSSVWSGIDERKWSSGDFFKDANFTLPHVKG
jgi:hypothetical protein